MSFTRYERYKQSGVEWLGDVPEHWSTLPLLAVGRERDERNTGMAESNLLSLSYGRIIRKDINTNEGLLPESFETYQVVYPGDIVFRLTDLQNDKRSLRTAIVEERGIITSAYLALEPLSANPQFLNYLFRAYDLRKVFYAMGSGVRQSMNYQDVKRMEMLLPPIEEQAAIARFLDRETAKIDALIEEQRRLIALLKEKRRAVISRAVTKGLNPSVPMRASRNPLIGSTPAHWQVVQVQRILSRLEQGWSPQCDAQPADPGEWGVLKSGCVNRGVFSEAENKALPLSTEPIPAYEIHAGDVLMSRASGSPELVGSTALVKQTREKLMLSDKIFRVHLTSKVSPEYYVALFNSDLLRRQIESAISGADGLANNLPQASLKEFVLTLPPQSEQHDIVAYLQRFEMQYLFAALHSNHMIELLTERRSALISAAVTGKINVTTQVAKLVRSTWSTGFARQVLAAEALSRCNGPRMGRIKLQKLIHLCEYHAQLDELGSTYSRKAAGPFDAQAMAGVRKGLLQQRWFEEFKDGGRYAYRPLEKADGHKQYLPHWEDKQARIDQVLNLLGGARTRTCEIASTLYAAWNDLLLEGKKPTDAEIIHEASSAERWHESKEKIDADKWPKALEWMRAKGLVPIGYGAHTKHQPDLFKREGHEPA